MVDSIFPFEIRQTLYLVLGEGEFHLLSTLLYVLTRIRCRICPGSHIALSMITLAAASVLSVFDLRKQTLESGAIIEPTGDYDRLLVRYVLR